MKKMKIEEVKEFINSIGGMCITDEYISSKAKLQLICPECKSIFDRNFDNIKTRKNIHCSKCSKKNISKKQALSFQYVKSFIESNSDCKLLSTSYQNVDEKLQLKCSCEKEFYTSFYKFQKKNKRQCNECGLKILKQKKLTPIEEIISIVESEGYKFLDNNTSEGKDQKVLLQCDKGHEPYWVRFSKFKSEKAKRRCPHCKKSLGEEFIEKELLKYNLDFNKEQKFNELRGIGGLHLRYDFAIIKNGSVKVLIEYDGKQHYQVAFNDELSFKRTKIHDKMKDEYASKIKVPLYRIPYTKYEDIPNIIKEIVHENYIVVEDIV